MFADFDHVSHKVFAEERFSLLICPRGHSTMRTYLYTYIHPFTHSQTVHIQREYEHTRTGN